ncbi:MAG TPA: YlmC/YmxH family sporulation protein [Pseudogracilibacillus sp.]|nr:YlmC/YmxH family sporulation protein [Pseudogracilibacillus sp.]
MVLLSELQVKEVILMDSGKRLGFIQDVKINKETGTIDSFVIVDRQMRGAFFQKQEEKLIDWQQIVTIGADIILVQQTEQGKNEAKIEEKIEKE